MKPPLSFEQANFLADLPLKGIQQEYPNKLDHVLRSGQDLRTPRQLHPAFYGCYDWHSAVHSHWTLVYLLQSFHLEKESEIRSALDENLSESNLQAEADYFASSGHASFERPYGWAWLLQLAAQLRNSDDLSMRLWLRNIASLENAVVMQFMEFLPKQEYPIRAGTHSNTAFALGLAFDYAVRAGNEELHRLIAERSLTYFGNDSAYPTWLEPSGDDFLSSCLSEADLMRRVLTPSDFAAWFDRFLPKLGALLDCPSVSDRHDPKIGHLDGLCLSKAWCMQRVANALPEGHGARVDLLRSSQNHAQMGMPNVASGDYLGEHWLASFAVYLYE